MLRVIRSMAELPFGKLMEVYAQSNRERGNYWKDETEERCVALAEQEFYIYLRQCFFSLPDSCYYLWEVDGNVVSAVRGESYMDGVILTALETHPCFRCKGYATALLSAVTKYLETKKIYVHIRRDNAASLSVHLRCGFVKVKSGARMLDGSFATAYDTYRWKFN